LKYLFIPLLVFPTKYRKKEEAIANKVEFVGKFSRLSNCVIELEGSGRGSIASLVDVTRRDLCILLHSMRQNII